MSEGLSFHPRAFAWVMGGLIEQPEVVGRIDVLYGWGIVRNLGRLRRRSVDDVLRVGRSPRLAGMADFYRTWKWDGRQYHRALD